MSTNINTSYFNAYQNVGTTVNNDNSKQSEFSDYFQKIRKCYDELGSYAEPSITNICSIWNNGFKTEGNNFYSKHSGYCDIYSAAASSFGDAVKQKYDLDEAYSNVEKSTAVAVASLKGLIVEEKTFMKQNKIETENDNQTKDDVSNVEDKNNKDTGIIDSVINFFFG